MAGYEPVRAALRRLGLIATAFSEGLPLSANAENAARVRADLNCVTAHIDALENFERNVLQTRLRMENMTDEEWTEVLLWGAEFESHAKLRPPTEPTP